MCYMAWEKFAGIERKHVYVHIPCCAECAGRCIVWREVRSPPGVSADGSGGLSLLHALLDLWEGLGLEVPQTQNTAHPKQGMYVTY